MNLMLKFNIKSVIKKIVGRDFLVQAVKFGLVGLLNTGITLLIIFILQNLLHINYKAANFTGYLLGFINSFFWNKIWTFNSNGPVQIESILFIAVFGVCYILQLAVLILLKENLKINVNIAQILGMIFYTSISFLGNKFITFRKGA